MTALNSIKINSIEIIEKFKSCFRLQWNKKKRTFPCYFLFSIMKLELDYSGGIFL